MFYGRLVRTKNVIGTMMHTFVAMAITGVLEYVLAMFQGKFAIITPDLIAKTRLDIVVNEDFVKIAVDAIMEAARSGNIGDGKIVVSPIDEVYRIRTGESGGEAI